MELKRYDNLTIEELCNLYTGKEVSIYDGKWFEVRDNVTVKEVQNMIDAVKEKVGNNKVDLNYREKYILIKENKDELIQKLFEFYYPIKLDSLIEKEGFEKVKDMFNMEMNLQLIYEKCMVRRVREKYPDLLRKYQKRFVEEKERKFGEEVFYEENTPCEYPIEVVYDMVEEEDMDLDIYKEFGYMFEGMKYAERIIDIYFQMECEE